MKKRRFTVDENGWLVDRDGHIVGRVVGITIEGPDLWGEGGSSFVSSPTASGKEEEDSRDGGAGETKTPNEVRRVWDHYCQVFADVDGVDPSRMTLNATRGRIIRNALKVRSVDECKRAIDGLARSPHHLGDNDRQTKYLDIRYALKGNSQHGESNEERIDKMAALAAVAEPTSQAAPRLPEGVSVEKAKRRLEDLRAHASSGHTWEPTRAAEARTDLEAWGFNIIELDAHPWVRLERKEQ